jgi:hypothetical protein
MCQKGHLMKSLSLVVSVLASAVILSPVSISAQQTSPFSIRDYGLTGRSYYLPPGNPAGCPPTAVLPSVAFPGAVSPSPLFPTTVISHTTIISGSGGGLGYVPLDVAVGAILRDRLSGVNHPNPLFFTPPLPQYVTVPGYYPIISPPVPDYTHIFQNLLNSTAHRTTGRR